MKTEGKIKTELSRTAHIMIAAAGVLVLLAFAAPQQAMAGSVTVPAPRETASIRLGVNDPPASATLKGWYCEVTGTDLRIPVQKMLADVEGVGGGMEAQDNAYQVLVLLGGPGIEGSKSSWPFSVMQANPVKQGMDAPPGGRKVYKFKSCYTRDELLQLQKLMKHVFLRLLEEEGMLGQGQEGYDDYKELVNWINPGEIR